MKQYNSNIKLDSRYSEIKYIFEKLFNSNGYKLNSYFKNDVWFLSKCSKIYNKEMNYTEIIPSQKYVLILQIINDIYFKNSRQSKLSNYSDKEINGDFNISVDEFINKITILLLTSQIKLDEKKDNFCWDEIKLKKLKQIKEKLQSDIFFKKKYCEQQKSVCLVSLKRFQYIPCGESSFKLIVKEMDSNFNIIKYEKKLLSNKKLKLLTPYEAVNLNDLNFSHNEFCFQEIYLESINLKKFQSFINNGGTVNLRRVSNKLFQSSEIENNENNKTISYPKKRLSKRKSTLNFEEQKRQTVNFKESITNTEIIFIPFSEFKIDKLIGLNIYTFGIQLEIDNNIYGCSENYFSDCLIENFESFLSYLNNFTNESKFRFNFCCNIQANEEFTQKNDLKYLISKILLEFEISLNDEIILNLLSKLEKICEDEIEYNDKYESIIKDILEIFHTIRDPLIYRLRLSEDDYLINDKKNISCCGSANKGCSIC